MDLQILELVIRKTPNTLLWLKIDCNKNNNLTNCFDKFAGDDIYVVSRNGVKLSVIRKLTIDESKTASSGIFKIVEKLFEVIL